MVLKLQTSKKKFKGEKNNLTFKTYGGPAIVLWRPRLCHHSLVPSGAGWQPGWQSPRFLRNGARGYTGPARAPMCPTLEAVNEVVGEVVKFFPNE